MVSRNVGSAMRSRSSAPSPPSLRAVAGAWTSDSLGCSTPRSRAGQAVDPAIAVPLRALRHLVDAGGKRLRPAFCYWAFVGAGGDPDDPGSSTPAPPSSCSTPSPSSTTT